MKSYTLKPFKDSRYRSIEDAIKELEALPDPVVDGSGKKGFKPNAEPITLESRIITIDSSPADAGKIHTQDGWIAYFNERNEIMVSMPDLYLAGKSGNKKLIENLRKDFNVSWGISSTRIIYAQNSLNAQIIHYFNSTITQPIVSKQLIIPVYQGTLLADVLNDKEGLIYLQTLFGTKDNADQIKDTLHRLSNYSLDMIKVWSAQERGQFPERASDFFYIEGGFYVSGSDIDNRGRSRGVHINTVGATPKNKGGVR